MMLNSLIDTCKDILTQLLGPKSLLPDSDSVRTFISRDKLYLASILGLKTTEVDTIDNHIRWQIAGAQYEFFVSPTT